MNSNKVVGIALILLSAWVASPCAAACKNSIGNLDSVTVGDRRENLPEARGLVIERDGERIPASNGLPLCEDDQLTTAVDATAVVMVGNESGGRARLTMPAGTTMVLRSLNAVELLVGRIKAALDFNFDVVMPLARLAATGTEFEVEVSEQGCAVDQLEGRVKLTPAAGPTTELAPLQATTCTSAAVSPVAAIGPDRCKQLLDAQSRAEIAARPPVRSANSTPLYPKAEADAVLVASREAAICDGDFKAFQSVARIRADWDRPQDALRYLNVPASGTPELDSANQLALGRALLRRGRPAEAIAAFRATSTQAALVAAESGIGDAERDLGLVAIRANDLAGASRRFDAAAEHYTHAFRATQATSERAVQLVNAGELALLRTRLDPNSIETRLVEAERLFEGARRLGDPPHARLGLAKINLLRAQLIPTQTVSEGGFWQQALVNILLEQQAQQMRKPFRRAARTTLRELVAAVPDFSPAEELLGEVEYQLGDLDESHAHFLRAIAADPGNTSAYHAYAETLTGNKEDRYKSAYRLLEVPAVRQLVQTRRETLVPRTQMVTVPANPLTADLTRVGFKDPGETIQNITLTNRSDAPATVSSVALTGANANVFRIRSDRCSGQAIPAGGNCVINVDFSAHDPGSFRATLEITVDGAYVKREVKLDGEKMPPPQQPVIL